MSRHLTILGNRGGVMTRLHGDESPSRWLASRIADQPDGIQAIDLACGAGRHTRLMAPRLHVLAIDRDTSAVTSLSGLANVRVLCADLETSIWPLNDHKVDLVVVSNYFWRPSLSRVFDLVRPGGWLLYETFSEGNGQYGKPSNPDFLVRKGELLAAIPPGWIIHEHWQGLIQDPKPAMRVRLAAECR